MKRSLLRFENAIKSEQTKKVYKYYISKFLEFSKIKNPDGLLQLKDPYLQELLEDYLFHLKKTISPNSLNPRFAALDLFFSMNDKTLNFKKIRKMFPSTVKRAGKDAWTTEDIGKMLTSSKSKRMKAIIHFLASTGCRVGALPDLKIRDVTDIENCKAVRFYEGSNEEYWGFLTPEATIALNDYLTKRKIDGEIITSESPLFRKSYQVGSTKAKPLTINSLTRSFVYLIHAANPIRSKEGKRHNVARFHGFRKRFNTILKDNTLGNIALKEKLMGHKGVFALDGTYHTPKMDTLFDEFKIHILELTIDDSERKSIKLAQLQEKNANLESENADFRLLQKTPRTDEERQVWAQKLLKVIEEKFLKTNSGKSKEIQEDLGRDGDDRQFL